ncbi:tRNA (cytidine(34)-2'-O)-methyltransferase [Rhodanobacter lindaniclasticus]
MLHVILFNPEIPPNTGNVIRLCANTGAALHLVRPLGFELDDARLRRAGLDYHEYASLAVHDDLPACLAAIGAPRVFAFSTRGRVAHVDTRYADGDALLFGCVAQLASSWSSRTPAAPRHAAAPAAWPGQRANVASRCRAASACAGR